MNLGEAILGVLAYRGLTSEQREAKRQQKAEERKERIFSTNEMLSSTIPHMNKINLIIGFICTGFVFGCFNGYWIFSEPVGMGIIARGTIYSLVFALTYSFGAAYLTLALGWILMVGVCALIMWSACE